MENIANTYVWIGVVFFLVFLALAYGSCWLNGMRWFVLTISALACAVTAFAVEVVTTTAGTQQWLLIFIFTWTFCAVFYVIAIRYVTHTKLLDITYQSHEALGKFITEHSIVSPLATVIRLLGPILLAGIVAVGGYGVWAKHNGMLV